jgi:hypothetical protein
MSAWEYFLLAGGTENYPRSMSQGCVEQVTKLKQDAPSIVEFPKVIIGDDRVGLTKMVGRL